MDMREKIIKKCERRGKKDIKNDHEKSRKTGKETKELTNKPNIQKKNESETKEKKGMKW